jgi:hypothetical protein
MVKKKVRTTRHFLQTHRLAKLLILLCVAVLVVVVLEVTNTTHFFHKANSSKVVVTAGTPVVAPKTSSSPSQASPKTATSNNTSLDAARNSGVAVDTKGSASVSTDSSQWTTSSSGLITVKQPTANSRLQDGSSIVGSSKLDQVKYRLKDNTVGVIAQGTLDVINGNFSGILHFQPQGTGGQLDIFSTDSRGVEYNEVQIYVSF